MGKREAAYRRCLVADRELTLLDLRAAGVVLLAYHAGESSPRFVDLPTPAEMTRKQFHAAIIGLTMRGYLSSIHGRIKIVWSKGSGSSELV